jgi:molybdenum cofactor biosynthesis protein MoaC
MKDISDKITTLRSATAEGVVFASQTAVALAKAGKTPKGNVWDIARAAGIMAAKKTSELIPYCHQIPLDHVEINFEPLDSSIKISATVKAINKTGVEMEALTAVSVSALTVYDMLKPIDNAVRISELKLVEKKGGKSDFKERVIPTAAVLVTSDSISSGKKDDKSGKTIVERLKGFGCDVRSYHVIPDEREEILSRVRGWVKEGIQLIVTTGGTGLGPRDVTVDTLKSIIEREVPGISEAMRSFGQRRTPYAMLSRGAAGTVGKTLIITLPGSSKGVKESLDAIFPHIFHIYPMLEGKGH